MKRSEIKIDYRMQNEIRKLADTSVCVGEEKRLSTDEVDAVNQQLLIAVQSLRQINEVLQCAKSRFLLDS